MSGIGKIATRVFKNYKQLVFNPEYGITIENTLKQSIEANKKANKSIFSGFGKQVKNGIATAEKTHINTSIRDCFKNVGKLFKDGWAREGFGGKCKGIGKALGKSFPLLMAGFMVITEIPNIISATKDKGLLGGIWETVKSAGRLGTGLTASSIGVALGSLIPIPMVGPILGGMVGFFAGEWLFGRIFGKSHSEKKAEQEALIQQQQQAVETQVAQIVNNASFSGMGNTATNTAGATQKSSAYNPYASMMYNPQLMSMQNALYSGKNSYSDDIMFNQAFKGLNAIG